MVERRRMATPEEVAAALASLRDMPDRIRASEWPAGLVGLDSPGLYAWWVDDQGAADLTEGVGKRVEAGRIYAGQTGATRWPSGITGSMTLRRRLGRNHIRGGVRSSTFRFTLAAALRESLRLTVIGLKRLHSGSERATSQWIARHLVVAIHAYPDPDPPADLEHRILAVLDPPLNLVGMGPSPVRTRLRELRAVIAAGSEPEVHGNEGWLPRQQTPTDRAPP